jgi:hypothetical protein
MDPDPGIGKENPHETISFTGASSSSPALLCDIDCRLCAVMAIGNIEAANTRKSALDAGKGSRIRDPEDLVERTILPVHFRIRSQGLYQALYQPGS